MGNILIIENDEKWRAVLAKAFVPPHHIAFWPNGLDLSEVLRSQHAEAVVLNLQTPKQDAFSLLDYLKASAPDAPVIVTSETEDPESIVKAVKQGAFEFIVKPYSPQRVRLALEQGLEKRGLKNEIDYLRRKQDVIYRFDQIIAESPAMK